MPVDFVLSGLVISPISAIGIGLGGVVTDEQTVASAPFLGWADVDLVDLLGQRTPVPTFMANDLAAFTEAQHWFGLGAGLANFAVLTLGIATGYGCVANGSLLSNHDSGVGLVGHWPLDPLGSVCSRGHRGCAEAMLSIPCLTRDLGMAVGRPLTWEASVGLARSGHPAAGSLFRQAGLALGQLVAAVANLTAPSRVIIGGEGVDLARLSWDAVQEGILSFRDPRASAVEVELANAGDEEWGRGAAVIAIQGLLLARRAAPDPAPLTEATER